MAEMRHPREVFDLTGHEAAEAAFEATRARGRLHHAWLLTGPEGAGKATFAYRAARRLLGAPADAAYGVLGASPDHPVSRQVIARSHPDLFVLERVGEDGKVRKVIPVDEARGLSEFFSKSPASAPHRVAIIDAADDLNVNAANAVLKTLEEPPPRGVVRHAHELDPRDLLRRADLGRTEVDDSSQPRHRRVQIDEQIGRAHV